MNPQVRRFAENFLSGTVAALVAVTIYTDGFTRELEDPKKECLYAAVEATPETAPRLHPGETILGRTRACDDLPEGDLARVRRIFLAALEAALGSRP